MKCELFSSVKQKSEDKYSTLSFFSLYRFTSSSDRLILFIGAIFTLIKALGFLALAVIYTEITSLLVDRSYRVGTSTSTYILKWFGGGTILTNATIEENNAEIINDSIAYLLAILAVSSIRLLSGIICVDCFNRAAISQVTQIRIKYFESLMRQEMGWYDIEKSKSNFTVRLSEDIEKIKNGIGEQFSHFLRIIMEFILYIVMAFVYGWQLTLILISYVPIIFVMNIFIAKIQVTLSIKELNSNAQAANVVDEVLSGIRTVFAFGGERIEVERYKKRLEPGKIACIRKAFYGCIEDAIFRLLYFAICALSFWFGVKWVFDDRDKANKTYTTNTLLSVFLLLITVCEQMVLLPAFWEILTTARASAINIFKVIDRQSKIDPLNHNGEVLDSSKIKGDIEFKDVFFSYPSRSDVQILNGLNLRIEAGQTVALVGNSGNGKSTCLHLIQRFYDPNKGDVLIDGYDIRSLNINSLRSNIATVGQEPVLFSTTIGENIRYGNPTATDQQIISAARSSGAHEFISKLPQGYNTMVGESGSQFSCGQKQRIAIARALVQNPKILILDEATSALDYHSEKYVQATLDRACEGRTTVVVSHRLSAVKNADRIVFIDKGQVVEDGTHDELITLKGHYFDIVESTHNELQKSSDSSKEDEIDDIVEMTKFDLKLSNCSARIAPSQIGATVDYWPTLKRILKLLKPDWLKLITAVISSIVLGLSLPIYSIVLSELMDVLAMTDETEAMDYLLVLCFTFLGLGVLMFMMAITQTYFLAKTSARLTQCIRLMTFETMLRQECGWFDEEENAVGVLSSYLSGDAATIQNAGFPLCIILQSASTVISGFIVGSFSSVKLTLICMVGFLAMLTIILMESRNMSKSEMVEKDAIAIGMKIASEAITNIRTVASQRQETSSILRFTNEMTHVQGILRKKMAWRGVLNSTTDITCSIAYGFAFCYGGYMVASGEIHYKHAIRVIEAVLYGVYMMSTSFAFAPTITTAFTGAYRLFKIIDRSPIINSTNIENTSEQANKRNDISFKRIDFRYPLRPDVQILREFNLQITEGKTIALVGPSGCGKSTCIQLLQRFYDPDNGSIHIGVDEISSDITLKSLRSKIGIVSQEPTLFDRTIAENIAYGDNSRKVTMDEIIEVAKTSNAHSFISQLPQGYDTNVGSRATQLSGGQKQRIAIARALIRQPKILLMDEPTSALDLHSEKVVQQALDSARTGRTCIIIAHRLSTIQNADMICVVQNGRIVQSGTHNELIALKGVYTQLYNAQK